MQPCFTHPRCPRDSGGLPTTVLFLVWIHAVLGTLLSTLHHHGHISPTTTITSTILTTTTNTFGALLYKALHQAHRTVSCHFSIYPLHCNYPLSAVKKPSYREAM